MFVCSQQDDITHTHPLPPKKKKREREDNKQTRRRSVNRPNLTFYAQSTSTVISRRVKKEERKKERELGVLRPANQYGYIRANEEEDIYILVSYINLPTGL